MTAPTYDRTIPSQGLTRDTNRGPVDTVAVERVRRGIPAPLSYADQLYLNTLLTGSRYEAALIARALGIEPGSVLRRYERTKYPRRRGRDSVEAASSGPVRHLPGAVPPDPAVP